MQKKNILNVFLAMVACVLSVTLYLSLMREMPSLPVLAVVAKEENGSKEKVYMQKIPVEATYRAVREKNLFSPERKEFIPEEPVIEEDVASVEEVAKINGNNLELQGVVLLGGKRSGLVLNPGRESERKYLWVTAGDKIGNLKVSRVLTDKLILRDGGKQYQIKLRDENKKKKTKARRVSRAPVKTTPRVVSATPSSTKRPPKKKTENNESGGETHVIHTPFGDIIRKK